VATFTYLLSDGTLTDTAVVSITVTNVNDDPIAQNDVYTTTEDVTLSLPTLGVLDNDSDIDGDALTAVLDTNVTSGTLSLESNGAFIYTPTLNFCGTDGFTYQANDGSADSNIASVTLNVTCANDAPLAVNDAYTTTEEITLTVAAPGVLSNDSDVEGDGLTAVLHTDVVSGSLSFNSDGSFDYIPDDDFCGSDSFTYQASDVNGDSNIATVILNVTCVNDVPTAVDDDYTVDENSSDNVFNVLANDSDVDGDGLSLVAVSVPGNGTAVISGTTILYTPDPDFVGMDTSTYTISDGNLTETATVTITVVEITTSYTVYLPIVIKP
jgi:VCBS repeat-containing protein